MSVSFALLAVLSSGLQDSEVPVWAPKAGSEVLYETKVSGTTEQMGDFSAETVIEQKVVKAGKEGFTLQRLVKDAMFRIGGQEIRDTREQKTELVYDSVGKLLKVNLRAEEEVMRLARATSFVHPGKGLVPGAKWSVEFAAVGSLPKASYAFTAGEFSGSGQARVLKVSGFFHESGGEHPWSGKADWEVNASTGQVVSTTGSFVNWLDLSGKAGAFSSRLVVR